MNEKEVNKPSQVSSLKNNCYFAVITTGNCYELVGICVPQGYRFFYPNCSFEVVTVTFNTVTKHQGTFVKGKLSDFKQALPTKKVRKRIKTKQP